MTMRKLLGTALLETALLIGLLTSLGGQVAFASELAAPVVKKQVLKQSHHKFKPRSVRPAFVSTPMIASPVADERLQDVVADQVHTGRMVCELGNVVTVTPDPQSSTGFIVQMRKQVYRMLPVVSSTGAIRLEDAQAGAMWLQLSNKSMLMNSKIGQRMADDCQSPAQMAVAEAMKLAPPPSLFDTSSVAKK